MILSSAIRSCRAAAPLASARKSGSNGSFRTTPLQQAVYQWSASRKWLNGEEQAAACDAPWFKGTGAFVEIQQWMKIAA
jgi:hypothetical protein